MTERGEKIANVCFLILGYGLIVPMGFFAIVMFIGVMIDSRGEYDTQHDRCLKTATSGYEIRECH